MRRYVLRRLGLMIPQVFGVVVVVFTLVRLLPGNPAAYLAGPFSNEQIIANLNQRLGLDKPIVVQFVTYMGNLVEGDFGRSWYTGQSVQQDLLERLPATLELISIALLLGGGIAVPIGALAAVRKSRILSSASRTYGLLAGAFPEFWLGLLLIFVFFFKLRWAPSPLGRVGLTSGDASATGFLIPRYLFSGQWGELGNYLRHLALPVVTLAFVIGGPLMRMTNSTIREALQEDHVLHAEALGLSKKTQTLYALRTAAPPVLNLGGVLYGYLLGGAVLVETVFGWGGIGLYAVQAIRTSDYEAIQGTVLATALFVVCIYLVVDLIQMVIDPRLRVEGASD